MILREELFYHLFTVSTHIISLMFIYPSVSAVSSWLYIVQKQFNYIKDMNSFS